MMWRYFLLVSVGGLSNLSGFGQLKGLIHFEDSAKFKNIEVNITVKTGNCYVRPTHSADALQVYRNYSTKKHKKGLHERIATNTYFIDLVLEQDAKMGVGQNISHRVFGSGGHFVDDFWTIYLSELKPYRLNMAYGLGDASIDLSGLSIGYMKVRTGNADVNIFYGSEIRNKVQMDTLLVQVDMGFINVRQLNLARAETVIAEVGFGGILLDFGDNPVVRTHVVGSVGTGSLVIVLPEPQPPIKIWINDSWLCDLNMHRSLREISKNTFVNAAYLDKKPDPLTFDIDVPMGMVIFK